ncbi:MAG: hypothetical protein Aurels2KO_09560 [Aureliella sp.]
MRVALLTNTSCRVNAAVRDVLIDAAEIELAHVFLYDTLGEFKRHPIRTIQQFGWLPVLQKAQHIFAPGLKRQSDVGPLSARQWCQENELPHTVVANMNDAESVSQLQSVGADALIVCVCKNILKKPALDACKFGAINIHPSLLPKYRGPCPTFWARYHQDERIGVTIHRMTTKIDSGNILGQEAIDADYRLTDNEIEASLFHLAADQLPTVLERIATGDSTHETAIELGAAYFPFPTAAQRRELSVRQLQ